MNIKLSKKIFSTLSAAALLLGASVASANSISLVDALDHASSNFDASTVSTFSVDIVANITDTGVNAGAVDIGWTAGLLNLDSVVIDPILSFNPSVGAIDNVNGTVVDIQGGNFGGLFGIFTMATLNFSYLGGALDTALINVIGLDGTSFGVWQSGGVDITFGPSSGATVSAVPVPPALLLFASAIAGLGACSRRKVKAI